MLAEMGHGDTIVIGDANFAAASMAKDSILVRCDGVRATEIMDAILTLMPLDTFVEDPVLIMDKEARDADLECPVWDEFKAIVAKHDPRGADACAIDPPGKVLHHGKKRLLCSGYYGDGFLWPAAFCRRACL